MTPPCPEKVHELLLSFHTAMLVTHGGVDFLHARPMEIAHASPDCHVWFFTDTQSPKTREIRQEDSVLLTFQKDHQKYLSIAGTADLVTDRTLIQSFWKEPFRVWFPEGINDPNLMLMHIIPHHAEYWDNSSLQGVRYLYEAAKAYVSSTPPQIKEGDQHGKVALA